MHGVVSLLDAEHETRVHKLWREFQQEPGLPGVPRTPIPHLSYHVAPDYDLPALQETLQAAAAGLSPLTISTSGLGIFTGEEPVVYLAVTRSPELSALHEEVWALANRHAEGPPPYYSPARWVPHITIAQGGLDNSRLAALVARLAALDLGWQIRLDNLALIYDPGDGRPHKQTGLWKLAT